MAVQHLIVAAVVAGSFVYAFWTLMPRAWRGWLWRALGRADLPAASGCASGCDGCSAAGPAGEKRDPAAPQPIRIHRR